MNERIVSFATKHTDSLSQYDVQNTLKERGCKPFFTNWVNGVTVYRARKSLAEDAKSWLFRVIIAYDGKPFKGKDPNINPVKRMDFSPQEFFTPTTYGDAKLVTQKYTWMCKNCGRVWRFRSDAQHCKHKDTVEKMKKTSIGFKPVLYTCIRREEI